MLKEKMNVVNLKKNSNPICRSVRIVVLIYAFRRLSVFDELSVLAVDICKVEVVSKL